MYVEIVLKIVKLCRHYYSSQILLDSVRCFHDKGNCMCLIGVNSPRCDQQELKVHY